MGVGWWPRWMVAGGGSVDTRVWVRGADNEWNQYDLWSTFKHIINIITYLVFISARHETTCLPFIFRTLFPVPQTSNQQHTLHLATQKKDKDICIYNLKKGRQIYIFIYVFILKVPEIRKGQETSVDVVHAMHYAVNTTCIAGS